MSPHIRPVLLLTLLVLASFAHVCGNDFIDFDDNLYVTENPHVLGGLSGNNVAWAFTTTHANFWHPLTWLSLQLDATLFGPNGAWGFHLTNLLLHLANVLVLYAVVSFMTLQPGRSFWVAALFAVHPLHVESVAWVTERKDVLSTLCWFLAMGGYAWYAVRPGWRRYLLVVVPFGLGLMVKPMLVTFPFALLLLDVWPLRRWPRTTATEEAVPPRFAPASPLRLVLEKLPLFLLAVVGSAWTFAIKRHLGEVVTIPLGDRLANAVISYGWYLLKTFLPTHLGAYYSHPFSRWSLPALVVAASALIAVTVGCILLVRRNPYLLVGWLWFLGTLVPIIGLVQVGQQARADRFVYVPHVGLFLAVVWSVAALAKRRHWRPKLVAGVAAAVVGVLAVLTWIQVRYWKTTLSLWEHTIAVTADNPRALAHLGGWYSKKTATSDLEKACKYLSESLRLREEDYMTHNNLAVTLARLHRFPEAIAHQQRALELRPDNSSLRYNLALMLLDQGQVDQAIDHLHTVLEQQPDSPHVHLSLGQALVQKGRWRWDDALAHCRQALELKPDNPQAYILVGVVLMKQGLAGAAEEQFRHALDLLPGDPVTANFLGLAQARQEKWAEAVASLRPAAVHHPGFWRNLAYALYQQGDRQAAREEYRRMTLQDPGWTAGVSDEALRLATDPDASLRDPQEALELALQTCQATAFQQPELLDILAVTQASRGDFAAARKTAADALAQAAGQTDLTRQIEERLRLYEKGRPVIMNRRTDPRPGP